MLTVNTGRMGYEGPDWLDITQAGNARNAHTYNTEGGHRGIGAAFAPSKFLLREFFKKRNDKDGVVTDEDWADYTEKYTVEMRISYRHNRTAWNTLLGWNHVVLLCFCLDPSRCHRRVLAGILVKLGAVDAGELVP